ncbi:MAG: putative transposase [Pseudohongiellaceae bacterium]|jgi:putative transposase
MDAFSTLLSLAQALLKSRQRLLLENLALRQQVAVLRRGVKRTKLDDQDRIFWITTVQLLDTWREALHIVQPDTVVQWHRRGYRCYWRRKSKARKIGRPTIGWELVHLI